MMSRAAVSNRPNTAGSALKNFSAAVCRGISQVLLIDNALTGFFVLLAITLSSAALGSIVLISSVAGTATAMFAGADKSDIEKGLFGYNSVLTGLALFLFLDKCIFTATTGLLLSLLSGFSLRAGGVGRFF